MASISVLTLNAGSSSLKASVFTVDGKAVERQFEVAIAAIAQSSSRVRWQHPGQQLVEREETIADHDAAVTYLVQILDEQQLLAGMQCIGHRLVHGGPTYYRPTIITSDVVTKLEQLAALDPEHTPAALSIIRAIQAELPLASQVACFDTGFFHELPKVAQLLPIPRQYEKLGLRRYGFHGLSYTYVLQRFAEIAGPDATRGRIIMAHLGSGSSLAAVRDGKPVDTTMGFSPASGVMMSSRSGDLDPGVAGYLHRQTGMDFAAYEHMVNFESGLLGVSGISADMLALLQQETSNEAAREAVDIFCYGIRKAIGSLTASLGGLDSLIFTGGIGEPAAGIRKRICQGLDFLGITLSEAQNDRNELCISAAGSKVGVHVIPTDEAIVICRQTVDVLQSNEMRESYDAPA